MERKFIADTKRPFIVNTPRLFPLPPTPSPVPLLCLLDGKKKIIDVHHIHYSDLALLSPNLNLCVWISLLHLIPFFSALVNQTSRILIMYFSN